MFKNILMCFPKYFDVVHYKLNEYMIMKKKVNFNLAFKQWKNLENNLLYAGVNIKYIKPQKNLVDMVFTANSALIYDNKALISNFNAIPRKNESKYYFNFFHSNGYDTYNMKTEFEGTADGLFSHSKKQLWIGYGFRSNKDSKQEITDIISNYNLDINTLKLTNPLWYNLNTCFCPFGNDNLILYEKAFNKQGLKDIYNVFDENKCIKVSDEDAHNFACNSISTINNIIIGHKYTDELKYKLKDINYIPIENNMSEFLLSGGSVKCSVLNINKNKDLKILDEEYEEYNYNHNIEFITEIPNQKYN